MNPLHALAAPSRPYVTRGQTRLAALLGTAALLGALGAWRPAHAAPVLPTGGKVQAGQASIGAPTGFKLTIDQASTKAVINWSSFSIGQGGQVQFNNGSGVTLNRVTGGGSLSQIDGGLSATGSLFLINPNGVIVGKSGVINVGGSIIASTLDVKDDAFLAGGDLTFSGAGGGVTNSGLIVSGKGDITLLGAQVRNDGTLQAPGGEASLAAGHEVVLHDGTLDDSRLSVTLGGADTSATNAGVIQAASVELRANGGNVYALAVNAGAGINATGVAAKDGNVYLIAEGGQVSASGEIDAHHADGSGGLVETSGNVVDFTGLKVKAGTWLIDPVNLTVDAAAAATIDATLNANTDVLLRTTVNSASGPGVQSSGPGDIIINAPITWSTTNQFKIDAYHSIAINAPITLIGSGQLNLVTNDGGTGGDYSFAPGANISFMGTPHSGESLFINNNFYSLIYSASDLPTFDNFVCCNWAVARSFSLDNQLYTHALIGGYFGSQFFFGTFAGLGNTISDINISQTVADAQFSDTGQAAAGFVGFFGQIGSTAVVRDLTLSNVSVTGGLGMVVGGLAGFSDGQISNVHVSGQVTGGDVDTANSFLVDGGGLVGLASGSITNSSAAVNVTVGIGTAGGLVGVAQPGASITNSSASGAVSVDADLTGSRTVMAGGLIGNVAGTNASHVTLSGDFATGSVNGGQQTFDGGFAGAITQATVSNSYATGAVIGGPASYAGGFVGSVDNSTITTSYASGAVSQAVGGVASTAPDRIGGFAGYIGALASVSLSYADGAVTTKAGPDAADATLAGGFVGDLDQTGASVTDSYATGSVTLTGAGSADTGGFAGLVEEGASAQHVYASGAVAASAGTVGGLAGQIGNPGAGNTGGSVSASYWDKSTTGQTTGDTLAGTGTAPGVSAVGGSGPSAYATASYVGFDFINTWTLINGETRPMLRSEYSTTIVNAHQLQLMSLHLGANYVLGADIDASETSNPSGIWNTANGFAPVGGTVASPFTGSLNGQHHFVHNLTIIDTTALAGQVLDGYAHNGFVGLFGIVSASGVVKNLSLANANVTGGDGMLVGALAGAVEGSVQNASSSGAVSVGNDLGLANNGGYASAGGLVGDAANTASILSSSSSADTTGGTANAGGLVGTMRSGATLTGGAASGHVTVGSGVSGGSQAQAGGLVGLINGFVFGGASSSIVNVTSSHASGQVSGGSFAALGGLVGASNKGAIAGSYATGHVSGLGDVFAGGFAGTALNTAISTSWASGNVAETAAAAAGGNNIAGGFLGEGDTALAITGSWSSGAVSVNGAGAQAADAGGFVGNLTTGASISGAYALGGASISNAQANDAAGGFAGQVTGAITNFYATGPVVSGAGKVGGLIGVLALGGAASTGYWDEGTTLQTGADGQTLGTATNLVGVGGGTGLNPFKASSYANFNLGTTWFILDGQTRPILRAEYSTTITDAHQLQLMALDRTATYTLAGDVNAAETSSATGVWNPANRFVPVGSAPGQSFTGTFNGNGFTISGLSIIDTTAVAQTLPSGLPTNGAVGLFGYAGSSSVLENVNLAGVSVTGGDGMVVGALVGSTTGQVTGATSSGTVTVGNALSGPTTNAAAGGLVGDLGDGAGSGLVQFSSSSATVTGGNAYVGGLVGWAHGGQILFSSASGAVTAGNDPASTPAAPAAGGLVGRAEGTASHLVVIASDFASGAVHGGSGATIGGLGGFFDEVNATYSYASGAVTQTAAGVSGNVNEAGGFVGFMGLGTIQFAFASGHVSTVGAIGFRSEAGGFVGRLGAGEIADAYATGAVSGDGNSEYLGGFAGTVQAGGGLDRILATGDVTGVFGTNGGLVGQFNGNHLNGGYWDGGTTNQPNATGNDASVDATEVGDDTGVDQFNPASYPELDFTNTWSIPSGDFYPELYGVSHVLKLTPQDLEYTYGDFPIFAFNVLGLQGGDQRNIVNGATVQLPGVSLSNAGFPVAGTTTSTISSATALGSTGAYRIIYDTANVFIDQRPIRPQLSGTVEKTYDGTTAATIDPVNNGPITITSDTGSSLGVLPGDDVQIGGSIPTSGTYDTKNAGGGIGVTVNGFAAPTGADVANYTSSNQSFDFIGQIDQAPLTINAVTDTKVYDGGVTSTGVPTTSGLIEGDSISDPTQSFDSKNAGGRTLSVDQGSFTISDGNGGGNYAITYNTAPGTITPAPLTIAAVGDTKVYDGTAISTLTPDVSGLVGGDTVTNLSQVFDSKNAGSRTMLVNTFTINDGNGGGNYSVTEDSNDGEITPKPISASLIGTVEKTYDGGTSAPVADSNLTLPGAIAGDDVSVSVTGPGTYATRNAGSGINVTVSGLSFTGDDSGNYTFTDGASGDVGIIDQASLTIKAVSDTRVYNGNDLSSGVPLVSGLVEGDGASGLSQVFDSKNAGSRTLSVNGFSISDGNGGNNYAVTLVNAEGSITPAPLTIGAVGDTKVYDGNTSSAGVPDVSGLVGSDTATNLSQVFDAKTVGSRTLTVHTFTLNDGNGGGNYNVTLTDNDGEITPRPLSASLTGTVERTYNATTSAPVTAADITLVNAVPGDALTVGVSGPGTYASPNVGTGIHVTVSGITVGGGDAGNYTFTDGAAGNVGKIDPATLTLTAVGDTKVYNGTTASSGAPHASGLFGEDSVTGLSQVFDSKNAGARTLTVNGFSVSDGNGGHNYTVVLVAADGSITPAPLTLSAVTDSKVYDGATSSDETPTVGDGLVEGDSVNGLSQAFDSKNAGSRTLNVNGFSISDGNGGHNYTVTLVSADGSITPAPLTVSAVSDTKVYDGNTSSAHTPTVQGLAEGDSVSSLSQSFDSKNAGARKLNVNGFSVNDGNEGGNYTVVTVSADGTITPAPLTISAVTDSKVYDGEASSSGTPGVTGLVEGDSVSSLTQSFDSKNAGHRTITVDGGYTVSDGNDGGNYTVTLVSATGTITPATLTLSAVSDTKTYDGGTSSGATPTEQGLVEGDSVAGLSQSFDSRNAGARTLGVDAGYTVNDGNEGGNYTVVLVSASGTITPATLTLAAVSDTKTYDGTTSSTGAPTTQGLVEGDSVSGLSQQFDSKHAGSRTLSVNDGFSVSDGNEGGNYHVVVVSAEGEITPKMLTVTLTGEVLKPYDGSRAASLSNANYRLSGVLGGDVVTLNDPSSGLYDTPFVGRGKTVMVDGLALSGASAGDYAVETEASGDVGIITIVLPIQPQIVTDPPSLTTSLTATAQQSLSFAGPGGSSFGVIMVFPVGNDVNDKGPGDNLPITGAGNGDLWEGSDLDDRDKKDTP
jgi:filamentous hemagglutinin family protein